MYVWSEVWIVMSVGFLNSLSLDLSPSILKAFRFLQRSEHDVNHWPNASVRHVVSTHNSIVLTSILPHINVTQDSCLSLPSFLGKLTLSFTWFVSHFLPPRFLLQMISKPQYSRTYFSNILALSAITNFKRWKHLRK